jgi:hypothetical protein
LTADTEQANIRRLMSNTTNNAWAVYQW